MISTHPPLKPPDSSRTSLRFYLCCCLAFSLLSSFVNIFPVFIIIVVFLSKFIKVVFAFVVIVFVVVVAAVAAAATVAVVFGLFTI
jgi:hypothetical protein